MLPNSAAQCKHNQKCHSTTIPLITVAQCTTPLNVAAQCAIHCSTKKNVAKWTSVIAALKMSAFFGALHLPLHASGLPKTSQIGSELEIFVSCTPLCCHLNQRNPSTISSFIEGTFIGQGDKRTSMSSYCPVPS